MSHQVQSIYTVHL